MPLEIRELVIKVTIEEQPPLPAAGISPRELQALKDRIVRECMDQLVSSMEQLPVR